MILPEWLNKKSQSLIERKRQLQWLKEKGMDFSLWSPQLRRDEEIEKAYNAILANWPNIPDEYQKYFSKK